MHKLYDRVLFSSSLFRSRTVWYSSSSASVFSMCSTFVFVVGDDQPLLYLQSVGCGWYLIFFGMNAWFESTSGGSKGNHRAISVVVHVNPIFLRDTLGHFA